VAPPQPAAGGHRPPAQTDGDRHDAPIDDGLAVSTD